MQPLVPLGVHDLRGVFASLCFFAPAVVAEDDRLLTANQVAEMLNVTPWWVYNRFDVPPIKIGRLSRWEPWRVRAFIDAHRAEAAR